MLVVYLVCCKPRVSEIEILGSCIDVQDKLDTVKGLQNHEYSAMADKGPQDLLRTELRKDDAADALAKAYVSCRL